MSLIENKFLYLTALSFLVVAFSSFVSSVQIDVPSSTGEYDAIGENVTQVEGIIGDAYDFIKTSSINGSYVYNLTNLYQAIIENAQFASIAANYPMITFIMQHSIKILIAVGALTMIVTFAKLSSPQTSIGGEL